MSLITNILVAFIAAIHLYIVWLEMFAWTTRGRKTFKSVPADMFEKTKVMAANQGLYNGFLAAGLIWCLLITDPYWKVNVSYFFLSCVFVAGVYGALTVQRSIFFVQALPSGLALLLLILSN